MTETENSTTLSPDFMLEKSLEENTGTSQRNVPKNENDKDISIIAHESTKKAEADVWNSLKLKQFHKLKACVRLVEFGLCIINNYVYAIGGQRKSNDAARFAIRGGFRLDPHIGVWCEISTMRTSRCLFYTGAVWDRLYVVGVVYVSGILSTVEYYIPLEDTWYVGPELPTKLHEHTGCTLDDKLYVSGGDTDTGHTNSLLCRTRPESKSWHCHTPMNQARSYHVMAAVGEIIYVLGGCALIDGKSCENYSPQADQWTKLLDLNTPVASCLPVVTSGQIVCMGSYSFSCGHYLNQCVTVSPATKSWKIVPLEFKHGHQIQGFYCVCVKLSKWLLKY